MQPKRISRRDLLRATAAGSLAAAGIGPWTRQAQAAAEGVGPMKITKIEAVRFRNNLRLVEGIEPNWMWVRLHTDKGIVGLGESYPGYEAHRGALKESVVDRLGQSFASVLVANLEFKARANPGQRWISKLRGLLDAVRRRFAIRDDAKKR